jgi:hypothetical protein
MVFDNEHRKIKAMSTTLRSTSSILLMGLIALFLVNCGGNPLGTKVKEPFSGSKYESNNRYFRATGKASSTKDAIAQSKAEMDARTGLAQQLQTTIQVVTDNYSMDVQGAHVNEAIERFETLVREVTNTTLADIRIIGQEKYLSDGKYTVYVAMEIKKAAMYRTMKKLARQDERLSKAALADIERLLDEKIAEAEAD